jgi:hypothetical protein
MSASLKVAHVAFQTSQATESRDWCCTVLDGHVVYRAARARSSGLTCPTGCPSSPAHLTSR